MPMTPGYYMPNISSTNAGFVNTTGYPYYNTVQPQQQSYAPAQQTQLGMQWVDGEIGAKAFQMPAGWPVNVPVVLWDIGEPIIYFKSVNQMGMPNPLYKVRYIVPSDASPMMLPSSEQSSVSGSAAVADTSKFVTKEDMEGFKNDIIEMLKQNKNDNNQSHNQNRGGGR